MLVFSCVLVFSISEATTPSQAWTTASSSSSTCVRLCSARPPARARAWRSCRRQRPCVDFWPRLRRRPRLRPTVTEQKRVVLELERRCGAEAFMLAAVEPRGSRRGAVEMFAAIEPQLRVSQGAGAVEAS